MTKSKVKDAGRDAGVTNGEERERVQGKDL
jgi:hypothetical protein